MTDHSLPENIEGMPDPCAHHTHEHVGWRKWAPLVGYLILVVGLVIALAMGYDVVKSNRTLIMQNKVLIEEVASDCFDRDGDLSYRHVLQGLIELNKNQKLAPQERRLRNAKVLSDGLVEAGPTPDCIAGTP